MPELKNKRYEAFCIEIVSGKSGTQAAIAAGYSKKTAGSKANQLLKIIEIKNRINELMEQIASEKIADAREIQEILTAIARGETAEEVVVVEGCGDGISEAKRINKAAYLKDRIKAAETLAKMQGAFDNSLKLEMTIPVFGGEDQLED